MPLETVFRILFMSSFLAMLAIRIRFQSKVLHEKRALNVQENAFSLTAGCLAALTTIVFGAEYLLAPGRFAFAYLLTYPMWLRWAGVLMLVCGIALLAASHAHLDRSFHSFILTKEDHVLVDSGPYRFIRHPIYVAYVLNYLGGGLLAGNWVLTVFPALMFALFTATRVRREELLLIGEFGDTYHAYMARTGRFFPKLGSTLGQRNPSRPLTKK
ncbi:MAG: isoprenylcysteine carboxylmethyltransferase family protein [Anaerolineales bacterium]|jgi:protein-S-isoprenylcysteine O-methyltransferase Ste14